MPFFYKKFPAECSLQKATDSEKHKKLWAKAVFLLFLYLMIPHRNKVMSKEEARRLALYAQGLLNRQPPVGKAGALQVTEHLGYVQIDTLAVAARAHHHTIWSRTQGYEENHLHVLLSEDKTIFEYWSHAASYLPTSHYRYTLPVKMRYASGKSHWFEQNKTMQQHVLERITAEGALQSKDFEEKQTGKRGMWEWKEAKRALEQLFMEGRLMVCARKGFQKVYDLSERVLPHWVDVTMPSDIELGWHLIKTTLNQHGLATEPELYYLRPHCKKAVQQALHQMLENGEVITLQLHNMEKETWYALATTVATVLNMPDATTATTGLHILSPFDNLVIQRKRLLRLFNFDYQMECYIPEAKRKYGYYCLPVLWNNRFIGRLDPKADRKTGIFYVKKWFPESNLPPAAEWQPALEQKLLDFARFCGCGKVVFLPIY
ncbi:winged helix-turn-helix domain-containing protein [Sphingobacteriales bacterium UPWRP_1]|nr:hypothetical protein BVG80_14775 [Sphingobacteriales bacterium TSM_CSM]PSJ76575.1 winged helix-turn-helix domain-containing protein [Sphingobacteriales bacterium UPWRP_1]